MINEKTHKPNNKSKFIQQELILHQPLKILIAHNSYSSDVPSGENVAVQAETLLLLKNGNQVNFFNRSNDEIKNLGLKGKIIGAFSTPWNPFSAKAIKRRIEEVGVDILHAHNTFPLLSPSIFYAAKGRAARVLTLHNYRLFCPAATPVRDSLVCTDCLDRRSSISAIMHGCYRGSRAATFPIFVGVEAHRILGTWTKCIDAFICLSDFQRELMIKAGLPQEKVFVKPNFYPGNPHITPWRERDQAIVFAGRLTAEKGLITLMRAWQAWGNGAPELRIVGDGDLRKELEAMAKGLPIKFLGQLPMDKAQSELAKARLLILPSEWFEGFPMVLREAFAFGTPSAVSNIGPLPAIVEHGKNGIVFEPANPNSLLHQVRAAWEAPEYLEKMSQHARILFQEKYTEDVNYERLIEIYKRALQNSRK